MRPPTSRSISGDVSGERLSARRTETRNDAGLLGPEIGEDRLGDRVDVERRAAGAAKLATPNTRETRSRTVSTRLRTQHDLNPPHQRANFATPVPRVAARRLCTSRVMNHGRFFPLSAISW